MRQRTGIAAFVTAAGVAGVLAASAVGSGAQASVARLGSGDDGRLIPGVGEAVRRARRDHHQRARRRVEPRVAAGEPHRAGHHVETLVVLAVPVLRRSHRVRRDHYLGHPEPVRGAAAVLDFTR